jgi:hypothetical protein
MPHKLIFPGLLLWALLIAQGAFPAAAEPKAAPAKPQPPATRSAPAEDSAKLAACERAWDQQKIKKGSRRRFIDACVKHG